MYNGETTLPCEIYMSLPADKIDKPYNLRLEPDLKALLVDLAFNNSESLNAHITTRLRDSLFLEGAGVERSLNILHELLKAVIDKERPTPPTALRLEKLLYDYNQIHSNQINQAHLAYVLGYEYALSVESFFSGKTTPSFSELKRFAGFFGCDEAWLSTGLGAPYPPKINKLVGMDNANNISPFVLNLISAPDTAKKIKSIVFIGSPAPSDTVLIARVFSDDSMQLYTLRAFAGSQNKKMFRATMLNVVYDAFRKSSFRPNTIALAVSAEDFNRLLLGQDHPWLILNGYIDNQQENNEKQDKLDEKYPLANLYREAAGFSEYKSTSLDLYCDESKTKDLVAVSIINNSDELVLDNKSKAIKKTNS